MCVFLNVINLFATVYIFEGDNKVAKTDTDIHVCDCGVFDTLDTHVC